MVINFKNLLSRSSLPILGLALALNLSLTPAQAMETLDDASVEKTSPRAMNNVLPDEILFNIFSQLSVQELGRCAQACQNWKQAASNDDLWGVVAKREEHNTEFPLYFAYGSGKGLLLWKNLIKFPYVQDKEIRKNREELEQYHKILGENMVQKYLGRNNNNAGNEIQELPPMHYYEYHRKTFSYAHINDLKNNEKKRTFALKNINPELFKPQCSIFSSILIVREEGKK